MKRLGKHLSQVPHGRRLDEKAKEYASLVQQQVQAVVNILYESLPEGQAEYLAELISHQVRVADRHGEPTDFPVKVRHRKRTEA